MIKSQSLINLPTAIVVIIPKIGETERSDLMNTVKKTIIGE